VIINAKVTTSNAVASIRRKYNFGLTAPHIKCPGFELNAGHQREC
jgi:hypothetical protein